MTNKEIELETITFGPGTVATIEKEITTYGSGRTVFVKMDFMQSHVCDERYYCPPQSFSLYNAESLIKLRDALNKMFPVVDGDVK